jgi:hypothetical protein
MNRYQRIIEHLDQLMPESHRICPVSGGACACNGCAGVVGEKIITQREIDLYKSGEMHRIAEEGK